MKIKLFYKFGFIDPKITVINNPPGHGHVVLQQPVGQPHGQPGVQAYGQPGFQPYGQPGFQPYGQPYGPMGAQTDKPGQYGTGQTVNNISGLEKNNHNRLIGRD